MCRLALFSRQGVKYVEEVFGLKKYLDTLEKSCGGHGNGIGLIDGGKVTYLDKGLKLSNEEIAKKMLKSEYDYAIYHTRVKSAGSIKDSNCHPYVNKEGDFLLCMNGTISEFSKVSKVTDITDTEIMFRLLNDNKEFSLKLLSEFNSRFLGVKDGKVFASNSDFGRLEYISNDNILVIASEFPKVFKAKELGNSLWIQGEKINEYVKPHYNNYSSNYQAKPYWNTKREIEVINNVTNEKFKEVVEQISKKYFYLNEDVKVKIARKNLGEVFLYDGAVSEVDLITDNVTGEDIFIIQSLEEEDTGGILDAI